MARKRKGDPVHGWLSIDKPLGVSSSAVVGRVRRALNAQKAGHGGTLDPLASGILPIALGEATKTAGYLMDARKTYRFDVTFGEARDTADAEGEVIDTSDKRPDTEEILAVLGDFLGAIEQMPPAYSALKVDGKRAYELARAGENVVLKARTIQIHRLDLLGFEGETATFETDCGKGTYVRSLAVDIAEKLGTVGYVSALRRLRVGPFDENNAITLENLEALGHSAAAEAHLLPVETPLDDIPAVAVTEADVPRLKNGMAIHQRAEAGGKQSPKGEPLVLCTSEKGRPVALCEVAQGVCQPIRVFNLPD